jgi:branched-chain amino acid transport system substrate-binding protein
MEGWVGTSLWDDENVTLRQFHKEYRARYPDDAVIAYTPEPLALWRDAMTVAFEALLLAPILTPAGMYEGLESLRGLPAAVGGPRQAISFGKWDRRGNKGADVVVLRKLKGGRTYQEGRIQSLL